MDSQKIEWTSDMYHLARLALAERPEDVHVYIYKIANKYRTEQPDLADQLMTMLREAPRRLSPLRSN